MYILVVLIDSTQSLTVRGAIRNGPVCWYIAGCQLLKCVDWHQCFHNYAKNNDNVVTKIINFMDNLTIYIPKPKPKLPPAPPPPIPSYVAREIASDVCNYINTYKLDFSVDYVEPWRVEDQQDVHEFLNVFFEMFIDPQKSTMVPKILKGTPQKQLKRMQEFIRKTFVFQTTEKLICVEDPTDPDVRDRSKENCTMCHFKVQPNNEPIHLQHLFNEYFSGVKMEI